MSGKNVQQCKKDDDCAPGSRCNGGEAVRLACGITAAVALLVSVAVVGRAAMKRARIALSVAVAVAMIVVGVLVLVFSRVYGNASCKSVCTSKDEVYDTVCKRCAVQCAAGSYIDCGTGTCIHNRTDSDCVPPWNPDTGLPEAPVTVASDDGRSCTADWNGSIARLNASCQRAACSSGACKGAGKATFDRFDPSNGGRCVTDCEMPSVVTRNAEIPACAHQVVPSGPDGRCGSVPPESVDHMCRYDGDGCEYGFVATANGMCAKSGAVVRAVAAGCRPSSNTPTTLAGGIFCTENGVEENLEFVQTEPAYVWPPDATGRRRLVVNVGVRVIGDHRPRALRYVVFPKVGDVNEISDDVLWGEYKGGLVYGDDGTAHFIAELTDKSATPIDNMRIGIFGLDDHGRVASVMRNQRSIATYGSPFVAVEIQSREPSVSELATVLPGRDAVGLWGDGGGVWASSAVGRLALSNLYETTPKANPFVTTRAYGQYAVVFFPGVLGKDVVTQQEWNEVAVLFAIRVSSSSSLSPAVYTFDGTNKAVKIELRRDSEWGVVAAGGTMWIAIRHIIGKATTFLVGVYSSTAPDWTQADQRSPLVAVPYTPITLDALTCANMRANAGTWTAVGGPMLQLATDTPGGRCVASVDERDSARSYHCLVTQGGKHPIGASAMDEYGLLTDGTFVWKDDSCHEVNPNTAPVFVVPGESEPRGGEVQHLRPFDFKATVDFSTEQCLEGVPLSVGIRCGAVAKAADDVLVSDVPLFTTDGGAGPVVSSDDVTRAIEDAKSYAKHRGLPVPSVGSDFGMQRLYGCDYDQNEHFRPLMAVAEDGGGGGWPWRDVGPGRFPNRYMSRFDAKWLPAADDNKKSMKDHCCQDPQKVYDNTFTWTRSGPSGKCTCAPFAPSQFQYPEHCAWFLNFRADSWSASPKFDRDHGINMAKRRCVYDILHPTESPVCTQSEE